MNNEINILRDRIKQLEKENEKLREEKRAHWRVIAAGFEKCEVGYLHFTRYKCSRCGNEHKVIGGYVPNYCEYCGAEMEDVIYDDD